MGTLNGECNSTNGKPFSICKARGSRQTLYGDGYNLLLYGSCIL